MSKVTSALAPDFPRSRIAWVRLAAYWLFTLSIAYEMAAGGIWDLLRIEYVRVILTHLGYPLYLLSIIGAWKIPCAVVILLPRFQRLKEWAYAGALFNYTGAAASLLLVGDGADQWAGPLVLAFITVGSWALRPPNRRLTPASPPADISAVEWVVPIVIALALLVFGYVTLPNGATL